jgi:hypothetical protein
MLLIAIQTFDVMRLNFSQEKANKAYIMQAGSKESGTQN